MKQRELGGPLTHEIGRGLDDAVIVCHLLSVFAVVVALSAMSSTAAVVCASAALILRIDRSSRARRYSRTGGRCGGILTQHRRQAVPEVWLS